MFGFSLLTLMIVVFTDGMEQTRLGTGELHQGVVNRFRGRTLQQKVHSAPSVIIFGMCLSPYETSLTLIEPKHKASFPSLLLHFWVGFLPIPSEVQMLLHIVIAMSF